MTVNDWRWGQRLSCDSIPDANCYLAFVSEGKDYAYLPSGLVSDVDLSHSDRASLQPVSHLFAILEQCILDVDRRTQRSLVDSGIINLKVNTDRLAATIRPRYIGDNFSCADHELAHCGLIDQCLGFAARIIVDVESPS